MMVVTYEVLSDKEFNRKFRECNVDGAVRECKGFTVLPVADAADLMGPHKLCQVYIRANQETDELKSTICHETVHVLQYLCDAPAVENVAYLLETVIHQGVK